MNSIGSNFASGFNPGQMTQKMNENFQNADTDASGTLSRTEAQEIAESQGIDSAKFDKMFDRMDANGDGEVSLQEQEDMIKAMEERMANFAGGGFSNESESFDSVKTLMESLSADTSDEDKKQQLEEMIEKMKSEGYSQEGLSESVSLLNDLLPPVNVQA